MMSRNVEIVGLAQEFCRIGYIVDSSNSIRMDIGLDKIIIEVLIPMLV
jgi:hypothetical protein